MPLREISDADWSRIVEAVKFVEQLRRHAPHLFDGGPPHYDTGLLLAKTPSGGIAARSGTTASSASCPVWQIDPSDGTMSATGNSITVFHPWQTAAGSEVYIAVGRELAGGAYITRSEDCP